MAQALQTRNIGIKSRYSGHVMAPMEIVYEVEEAPKRLDGSRLFIEEWSAPNPWVTAGLYVFFIIPCWALGLWLLFN